MDSEEPQPAVTCAVGDGIAHIRLARPRVSNAINLETAHLLGEVVAALEADVEVRAVVVTGSGPRFCAGGDVAEMVAAPDRGIYVEELASALDASLQKLAALDKPVVVGVHGAVAGAGLALMLSCDLVVAGEGTRFAAAYSGVGLTPDCGVSWLLPRAIGQQRALHFLLENRVVRAAEALSWGLVTEVVADEDVPTRAIERAGALARGPAEALGQTRRLLRASWESSRAASGADEARTIGRAVRSDEALSRLMAFTGG